MFGGVSRADWEVVGVGDFDGNKRSDILWQNKTTGAIGMWESGNAANWVLLGSVPRADWTIIDVGDFDGNNKSDILLQHTTGTIGILESGTTWQLFGSVSRTDWEVVGVADYDGNNKSDILWQNKHDGITGMWEGGNSANWTYLGSVDRATWMVEK
jgi:hypothetical protein